MKVRNVKTMPPWPEETLCEYRSSAGPVVTHVRGTVLVSSLRTLKEAGLFERYQQALESEWRDAVLHATPMSWIPITAALAHYDACDGLALPDTELVSLGDLMAERFASTFLGTLVRAVRDTGIDAPLIALRAQPRFWDRIYMGGTIRTVRTGPKDIVNEISGLAPARFRYYRVAFCGYYRGIAKLLGLRAYVKLLEPQVHKPDSLVFRASWV